MTLCRRPSVVFAESTAGDLPAVFWHKLALDARRPRGKMLPGATSEPHRAAVKGLLEASAAKCPLQHICICTCHEIEPRRLLPHSNKPLHRHRCCAANEALERDMFGLVWGPTLAAVSVILDNAAQDPGVARRALDCLLLAARLATYHGV